LITGLFAFQQTLTHDRSRDGCFAAFKNNIWVGVVLLAATLIEVV
jgi:4-hydroxybenzoate polyprenyltransferase